VAEWVGREMPPKYQHVPQQDEQEEGMRLSEINSKGNEEEEVIVEACDLDANEETLSSSVGTNARCPGVREAEARVLCCLCDAIRCKDTPRQHLACAATLYLYYTSHYAPGSIGSSICLLLRNMAT